MWNDWLTRFHEKRWSTDTFNDLRRMQKVAFNVWWVNLETSACGIWEAANSTWQGQLSFAPANSIILPLSCAPKKTRKNSAKFPLFFFWFALKILLRMLLYFPCRAASQCCVIRFRPRSQQKIIRSRSTVMPRDKENVAACGATFLGQIKSEKWKFCWIFVVSFGAQDRGKIIHCVSFFAINLVVVVASTHSPLYLLSSVTTTLAFATILQIKAMLMAKSRKCFSTVIVQGRLNEFTNHFLVALPRGSSHYSIMNVLIKRLVPQPAASFGRSGWRAHFCLTSAIPYCWCGIFFENPSMVEEHRTSLYFSYFYASDFG